MVHTEKPTYDNHVQPKSLNRFFLPALALLSFGGLLLGGCNNNRATTTPGIRPGATSPVSGSKLSYSVDFGDEKVPEVTQNFIKNYGEELVKLLDTNGVMSDMRQPIEIAIVSSSTGAIPKDKVAEAGSLDGSVVIFVNYNYVPVGLAKADGGAPKVDSSFTKSAVQISYPAIVNEMMQVKIAEWIKEVSGNKVLIFPKNITEAVDAAAWMTLAFISETDKKNGPSNEIVDQRMAYIRNRVPSVQWALDVASVSGRVVGPKFINNAAKQMPKTDSLETFGSIIANPALKDQLIADLGQSGYEDAQAAFGTPSKIKILEKLCKDLFSDAKDRAAFAYCQFTIRRAASFPSTLGAVETDMLTEFMRMYSICSGSDKKKLHAQVGTNFDKVVPSLLLELKSESGNVTDLRRLTAICEVIGTPLKPEQQKAVAIFIDRALTEAEGIPLWGKWSSFEGYERDFNTFISLRNGLSIIKDSALALPLKTRAAKLELSADKWLRSRGIEENSFDARGTMKV